MPLSCGLTVVLAVSIARGWFRGRFFKIGQFQMRELYRGIQMLRQGSKVIFRRIDAEVRQGFYDPVLCHSSTLHQDRVSPRTVKNITYAC